MTYLQYIETDGACWFDTNIVPDVNTKVEMVIAPLDSSISWCGFIGAQNSDDDVSTFQIRRYDNENEWAVKIGEQQLTPYYAEGTGHTYHISLDRYGFEQDGVNYSFEGNLGMTACNYTIYISAIHNPEWQGHYRAGKAQIGEIKIYQNDIMVAYLIPADNNGTLGFYDTIAAAFRGNLGNGTPVAGPILSTMFATYSGGTIAASGGTASIDISSESNWTASTSASFVTLFPSTGDTGTTAMTATFDSNSGDRRSALIEFVNATGDTAEVTISQKKAPSSAGTPFYLGVNEVTEIYLGNTAITEAYLGNIQVFSSGSN